MARSSCGQPSPATTPRWRLVPERRRGQGSSTTRCRRGCTPASAAATSGTLPEERPGEDRGARRVRHGGIGAAPGACSRARGGGGLAAAAPRRGRQRQLDGGRCYKPDQHPPGAGTDRLPGRAGRRIRRPLRASREPPGDGALPGRGQRAADDHPRGHGGGAGKRGVRHDPGAGRPVARDGVPRWVSTPTQPIAADDVVRYIAGVCGNRDAIGQTFDAGGPEVMTYREMIERIARLRHRRPVIVEVPFLTPRLSSLWLRLVTPVQAGVARPLIDGLRNPTVAHDTRLMQLVPFQLTSFDAAAQGAITADTHNAG